MHQYLLLANWLQMSLGGGACKQYKMSHQYFLFVPLENTYCTHTVLRTHLLKSDHVQSSTSARAHRWSRIPHTRTQSHNSSSWSLMGCLRVKYGWQTTFSLSEITIQIVLASGCQTHMVVRAEESVKMKRLSRAGVRE